MFQLCVGGACLIYVICVCFCSYCVPYVAIFMYVFAVTNIPCWVKSCSYRSACLFCIFILGYYQEACSEASYHTSLVVIM